MAESRKRRPADPLGEWIRTAEKEIVSLDAEIDERVRLRARLRRVLHAMRSRSSLQVSDAAGGGRKMPKTCRACGETTEVHTAAKTCPKCGTKQALENRRPAAPGGSSSPPA